MTYEHTFGTIAVMRTYTLTKAPQIAARLSELDSAIAGLQIERLQLLSELRSLDEADGKSERQTAITVAQYSRSSARVAANDVRFAMKVAALPLVSDAVRSGAISIAQLASVAAIATPQTQAETIAFAQQVSIVELERAAAVRRRTLDEDRRRAQKNRFLSFTHHEDHTSIRGSLPYLEGSQLEAQLRKIADRLYLGETERPSASVRMADALLIFTKFNPANALADSLHDPASPSQSTSPVIDFDEEPFPETTLFEEPVPMRAEHALVVVNRSDTRIIIHWNAQTGIVNYENGPPIDHARLTALLCDATLEVQHHDTSGKPNGLVTTAHHSNWRQDRYLAYRDGRCRVPNCPGIGKTQVHHLFEDRADRVTDTKWMINLCNYDHGRHHDGQLAITGDPEGIITFSYPEGRQLHSSARPAMPKSA